MANNYNPYNANFYMQDLQNMRDRIDRTMQNYQQTQNQFAQAQQQQPQIQQTFQLSNPGSNTSDFDGKYAESIDEVKNILVFKNSLFVNKNMDKLWFKDTSGNIRKFSLTEIFEKSEKDMEIEELKKQIEQLTILVSQQFKSDAEPQPIAKIEPVKKFEKKNK